MKRLGIISLVFVLLIAAVVGGFYGHFVERIIFVLNDDKDLMAENFRITDTKFNHHIILKSSLPQPLPRKLEENVWPETFESHGEIINSDDFLKLVQTTGLVILENGHVIYEDYWHGLTAPQRQFAFSVAKSMTSIMVGFAIDDGLIENVNDPVVKYLPNFKGSAWDKATIANMLEMSSGVDFDEDYSRTDTDMMRFQKGFLFDKPIEPFLLALTSKNEPGIKQGYNSMETQMAGMLLSAVLGEKSISDYMHEKLWQPLGTQDDATWTTDITGQEITIGGLSMSLRDVAKVGQMMLQRGQWQGQQLLSESWVLESTTPVKPYQLPGRDNPLSEKPFGYGYLWWTPVDPNGREFYASGLHGQYLFVNEPAKLVVALYSANPNFNDKPDWWKERYEDFFQAIAKMRVNKSVN
ncbi:serine hydrolase [Paraglaciecola sp. 20A4]|uniref:serine hydrolase domain-containing protein n=1 Tax=Paraglaciecola sp. 20A4 TaxID=2687288 RepID=UPI00140E2FA3|nr:serine hydrolase [Paraglaciecola sp. 20A4]